jgi:ketosteroid isomerase-like protein
MQRAAGDAAAALLEADRAWARTTTAEAFKSFLTEDAIYLYYNEHVMFGAEEWGPWLDRMFATDEFVLDWKAARVEVGPSADMGYTAGDWVSTWRDAEGVAVERTGSYVAIWERQDDGEWKVIAETEAAGTPMFRQGSPSNAASVVPISEQPQ